MNPTAAVSLDTHAIVALGANEGRPAEQVRAAFRAVAGLAATPPVFSGLWRSEPVDCPPGSPPFINAVMAFEPRPGATPESLLAGLRAIERVFGRRPRSIPNAPRPLDLDLIAFRREIRATPFLTLPHPRAHQRAFVLAPLAEIAPGLCLPGRLAGVRELLAALPPAIARPRRVG
jgi:2-amino-4-hydroxy-6-hydroxymethyldihydropteridine diphosphokinase